MNTSRIRALLNKTHAISLYRLSIVAVVLLCLAGGYIAYQKGSRYVNTTQGQITDLKRQQAKLLDSIAWQQTEYANDKKAWEEALKTSQDKIAALEKQVAELDKKITANRLVAAPKPVAATSVYDRIVSDDPAARQKLVDAIKLIETNTPFHFSILKTQVQKIQTVSYIGCGGGAQIKRTIYISYDSNDCLTSTPVSTFASVVVHEAYHVHNVYVNKVTTSGKEQELPSLYAQRDTFNALGVVQSFRDYVLSLIAYYESL